MLTQLCFLVLTAPQSHLLPCQPPPVVQPQDWNNLAETYWQVLEANHGIMVQQTSPQGQLHLLTTCAVYFRKLADIVGKEAVLARTKGWDPVVLLESHKAQEREQAAQERAAQGSSKQPNPNPASSTAGPSKKRKNKPQGKPKNHQYRSNQYKEDWAHVLQVGEALLGVQQQSRIARNNNKE